MTIESILSIPNIYDAKRVLCIQPHYDDTDIGAGGTFALLHQNGAEPFYLTATDDLMGVVYHSLSDEEATPALKHDQFAAGKIIGVKEQFWLGYPDTGDKVQFTLEEMDQLMTALDAKSQQVATGETFQRGETLKVLHTSALHSGI